MFHQGSPSSVELREACAGENLGHVNGQNKVSRTVNPSAKVRHYLTKRQTGMKLALCTLYWWHNELFGCPITNKFRTNIYYISPLVCVN